MNGTPGLPRAQGPQNPENLLCHTHAYPWHRVVILEPWHDPKALRRATCLVEAVHAKNGAVAVPGAASVVIPHRLDVAMPPDQQATFEWAFAHDYSKVPTDRPLALSRALSTLTPLCDP